MEKLKETENPPLVLHLATLILFQNVTQNMLNASGRFVSNILSLINGRIAEEDYSILQQYYGQLTVIVFTTSAFAGSAFVSVV